MQLISPLPQRARRGSCTKCGSSSSKRKYFDLGVFIEFEGGLFLCAPCVTEMGGALGLLAESQHEFVKESNQKLLRVNAELRERIASQNTLIDTLSAERLTREAEQDIALEQVRHKAIQETESRYNK